MSNRFTIGTAELEFSPDTTVSFQDGGMAFDLRARPVPFDARRHPPVFDPEGGENPEPGKIAPSFWSATFHFDDAEETPRLSIRRPGPLAHELSLFEKGFAFGTRFFGEIDVTVGRIELRGLLKHDYEADERGTPVHVVWTFPAGEVTPRPHTYRGLAEALSVRPERVRRLFVGGWDGRFRHEILRFTRLEFLSLQHVSDKPAADATPLPDAFCDLSRLRELFVRGAGFPRLPDRFGDLGALEALSLEHGALEELPASIERLGRLTRLTLDGNRLKTLPDLVGHLPALQSLSVNGNPFESLPASLARLPRVSIEKRNEALFRDIRYRPDVDVAVDREALLARGGARQVALLRSALARHGLSRYEEVLLRHARRTLRLVTTDPADGATPGRTRIGGAPDLPPGVDYPTTDGRHWRFHAQLDLAEVAPLQSWLPRTGLLYFFAEGQEQGDGVRVLHATAPAGALRPYGWPEDTEFTDGGDASDAYAGFDVRVDATVSVPNLYGAHRRLTGEDAVLLEIPEDDDLQRAYWALQEELTGDGRRKHGAHLMNAHVFTQSESPEEQASREVGGLPGEWVNLLSLDSDVRPGFCFWDAGTFTYGIHEKDLALADFSRVHWSLESS